MVKKKEFALGKDRAEMAITLYSALVVNQEPASTLAKDAITILGLLPDLMVQGYEKTATRRHA